MSEIKAALPDIPKPAEWIPVFSFNLELAGEPANIFEAGSADLTLNLATIKNGAVKTVPNKLNLELEIDSIYGTDELSVKNSTNTALLHCNLYGKTPSGTGVKIFYPGKVQLTAPTVAVLSKQSQGAAIEESYVTCNPVFYFDDKVEDKYKWALKENFFGRGRFVRSQDGVLHVQYYVYVLR
ncbi:hypothetical protein Cantr_05165 [Candida viswanathii]|uniref:Uncharacterized protein n=1 Tax=Candida viswanathii TaxID=5486 RepID=A0A367XQT3_9ASCO|nr:hypothetical protein Cantr_05165 [Candida viswanathii]